MNASAAYTQAAAQADKTAPYRSAAVVREAGIYERFGQALSGTYTALSMAFNAASSTLMHGENIKNMNDYMEVSMTADDIDNDSKEFVSQIEAAREQLASVWENIPAMNVADRPEVESRYFEAVGNLDQLMVGERRREFVDKAEDTIYSDDHRKKFGQRLPPNAMTRLEQYGIKTEEIVARTQVENVSKVLESYWIERDAQAIAENQNLDLSTQQGRDLAFNKAEELYSDMLREVDGLDLGSRQDWQEYERASADYINGMDDNNESISHGVIIQQVEQIAAKSDTYAQLISTIVDTHNDYEIDKFNGYVPQSERYLVNSAAASLGYDLNSDQFNAVHLESDINKLYYGNASNSYANEILDMSKISKLDFDKGRELVEAFEKVLGKEGLRDLQNGDAFTIQDKFSEAGINIDGKEAFTIAEKYISAMKDQGYDMGLMEKSIGIEKELYGVETELQQSKDDRNLAEKNRQDNLNHSSKLGL